MKACIFLGPSLEIGEARQALDATYLPPVAMGDVYAACCEGFQVIGIIDGFFEQVPSVWHKEILYALSTGVRVYGASSMGALRAAELHAFGMRGVGRIFEAFARGEFEDDDEVAVAHAPDSAGYRPISEAMVNIRDGLQSAEREALIAKSTSDALIAMAKARFYPERSWPAVLHDGRRAGLPGNELDALAAFVKRTRPNRKRADALALLARVRADIAHDAATVPATVRPRDLAPETRFVPQPEPALAPSFDFEPSIFWDGLKAERTRTFRCPRETVDARAATVENVVNLARVTSPHWARTTSGALLRMLAQAECARLGLEIDDARVARAAERFRRKHGLLSAAKTHEFLSANRLSVESFTDLVRSNALIAALVEHHRTRLGEFAAVELMSSGEFAALAAATETRDRRLGERGLARPSIRDTGVDDLTVLTWYAARAGRPLEPGTTLADELGFDSVDALLTELVALFLMEALDAKPLEKADAETSARERPTSAAAG